MSNKRGAVRRPMAWWKCALLDLLLGVLILLVFLFFHNALPILRARSASSAASAAHSPVTVAASTPAPTPAVEPVETAQAEAPEESPEPTPDLRTEWQIRFAEHFTDEVVVTDHSYTSPEVSIDVQTISYGEGSGKVTYHVADIYIARLENFRTYTANNELRYFSTQDVMEMDAASGALLAISGDFYCYQGCGMLIRNGEVYTNNYGGVDVCVMYYDGSIAMYRDRQFNPSDLAAQEIYQAWNFGPSLLDDEGHAQDYYNVSTAVSYINPRSALGYYEPGHYCFVVVDGRQDGYSAGMTLPQLAKVFEELGCVSAYNLDGGGSAVMTFMHERYSRQSNGGDRLLGDILLIAEAPTGEGAAYEKVD